eukprot:GHRR01016994.1.p1 GENE.GHRR01016994.1~~GHRR01016994.1.p1  ORF type:complete len:375 (+),score=158.83 GHRR01016994.1:245-1369(+)
MVRRPVPRQSGCESGPFDALKQLFYRSTGCPCHIADVYATTQKQGASSLQLKSWSQLADAVSWFCETVLVQDKAAKLAFPPCLPKECRANVHSLVSKKHSKVAESVSEGFGDERHVAVVAKGASASRSLTAEQADHALALWLLYGRHSKLQSQQQQNQLQNNMQQQQQLVKQQQQQQAEHPSIQQNQQSSAANMPTQPEAAADASAVAESWQALTMEPDSSTNQQAPQRDYTRDEVAQMLVQDKLPADLSALWLGPAGEAQRQARLICLAASAGDVQELQELLASNPYVVRNCVPDLASGGQLPLHLAAAGGRKEVLQLLLAAGADMEAVNGAGETALQVAQRCEECDCEAALLQAGAKHTKQDSWQQAFTGQL